ncbi:DUF3617 domain-containing protein [Stakelama tenebrarum]|uniref:DUF3617 domain-containing protein n=1 Tax=Stakelama tenebrarum TaxID=2711215 RepID=A0A6G6Y8S2_9SPHN|nr:DUF3617 domain-containing protein [Sphingosinithalassobacter tenebrarum]QIG81334.1 DUF3617 domain-containing protein [Sphingosinithalassobacter tenebrarum]
MRHLLATTALVMLAACNGGEPAQEEAVNATPGNVAMANASSEQATEAAQQNNPMLPGLWEQKTEITSLTVIGVPDNMRQAIEQNTRQLGDLTSRQCFDKEQAAKGGLDAMISSGGSCTYDRLNMSGGEMDVAFHCSTPQQDEVTGTITGTSGPESSDVTLESQTRMGAIDGGLIGMEMHITKKRIGDCPE